MAESEIHYKQKIKENEITCEYMKKSKSDDPLRCPIYSAMKNKYEWNKQNLDHLVGYTHHVDEQKEKPKCRYGDECKASVRLEEGGNKISDECHMKL
eukprot:53914_1